MVRPGARPCALDAALQPVLGARAQFGRLVDRSTLLADREARQDRRLRPRPEGAALRDLDRRRERLGQVGEQRHHLGAGLEPVLGRELAPVGLDHEAALRRCRSARRAPRNPRAWRTAARWWRRAECRAHRPVRSERCLGRALARGTVALQFDIETIAEQPRQRLAGACPRGCPGPASIAASSGPPGPPVSAISPSVSPSSQASLRCGFSFGAVSRKARELSRIRLR